METLSNCAKLLATEHTHKQKLNKVTLTTVPTIMTSKFIDHLGEAQRHLTATEFYDMLYIHALKTPENFLFFSWFGSASEQMSKMSATQ